jgi:hypothetical protein
MGGKIVGKDKYFDLEVKLSNYFTRCNTNCYTCKIVGEIFNLQRSFPIHFANESLWLSKKFTEQQPNSYKKLKK